MGGALPRRPSQFPSGASAVSTMSVPLLSRLMVFFLELSSAERTPRSPARSKIVGARRSFASSMYSSVPVAASKYELPITPCAEGQSPQQIEALLQFVTLGITPRARACTPLAAHAFSVGIGLRS